MDKALETCAECGGDLSADCHQESDTHHSDGQCRWHGDYDCGEPECRREEVSEMPGIEELVRPRMTPANHKPQSIWCVTKPKENSVRRDICFKIYTNKLGLQFLGGLLPSELVRLTPHQVDAETYAEWLLAERDSVPICEHCGHRAVKWR